MGLEVRLSSELDIRLSEEKTTIDMGLQMRRDCEGLLDKYGQPVESSDEIEVFFHHIANFFRKWRGVPPIKNIISLEIRESVNDYRGNPVEIGMQVYGRNPAKAAIISVWDERLERSLALGQDGSTWMLYPLGDCIPPQPSIEQMKHFEEIIRVIRRKKLG